MSGPPHFNHRTELHSECAESWEAVGLYLACAPLPSQLPCASSSNLNSCATMDWLPPPTRCSQLCYEWGSSLPAPHLPHALGDTPSQEPLCPSPAVLIPPEIQSQSCCIFCYLKTKQYFNKLTKSAFSILYVKSKWEGKRKEFTPQIKVHV